MPDQSNHVGIVVGVDGSAASTAPLRWATQEAAMRNVELTIVHAAAPPMPESSLIAWSGPAPSEILRRQKEEADRVLTAAAKTAGDTAAGVRIHTEPIDGAPVPALLDLSEKAELMVVGRRGGSSLTGVTFGSVSNALVHHAHCPVAIIHDEPASAAPSADAPVVVGIDGSPASERATALAFDEASWRGVDLVALHASVDSDPFGIHELEWAVAEPKAMEALAERLAGWQERYPDVNVQRVLIFDRPAHHLLEQAETAQLVVVGSRGHGELTGRLLGSVSSAVMQATHTPVIVARPG